MKKIAVLVLAAAVYLSWGKLRPSGDPSAPAEPVVLYATEWCGYCKRARRFLRDNGIAYVEYDIEKSAEGRQRYRELGGSGVPLLQVNGRVIRGYRPDAILDALR